MIWRSRTQSRLALLEKQTLGGTKYRLDRKPVGHHSSQTEHSGPSLTSDRALRALNISIATNTDRERVEALALP